MRLPSMEIGNKRMRKVNEIFYSLQGEGFYSGTAAIFVRFSGCNLHCDFCDTNHQNGKLLSREEILEKISKFESKHLIFTGGEPTLSVDYDFVQFFKDAGYYIQIETNGTNPVPENIDWVTCRPKEDCILTSADELKVVYTGQDLNLYNNFSAKHKYLQPCSMKNTSEVIEIIKHHPQWKLSVQLHKLIGIE